MLLGPLINADEHGLKTWDGDLELGSLLLKRNNQFISFPCTQLSALIRGWILFRGIRVIRGPFKPRFCDQSDEDSGIHS